MNITQEPHSSKVYNVLTRNEGNKRKSIEVSAGCKVCLAFHFLLLGMSVLPSLSSLCVNMYMYMYIGVVPVSLAALWEPPGTAAAYILIADVYLLSSTCFCVELTMHVHRSLLCNSQKSNFVLH